MDDSAACGHPLNVSRLENAFIPIVNRPFEHERHRLEPRVRVRSAGRLAVAQLETIVREKDERIVAGELIR